MKRVPIGMLASLALCLSSGVAHAATARTAVSITGSDTNPCSPALPCRTIAYALTQTSPGGELLVLSPGGYGPFTITQAVQILAPPGNLAAVTAATGDGVTINAGPSDAVVLRGFYIDGQGSGQNGIVVNTVGSLGVTDSSITGFDQGINFVPTVNTGNAILTVTGCFLFGNRTGSILVKPMSTSTGLVGRASITGSHVSTSPITLDGTNSAGRLQMQIYDTVMRYVGGNAVVATAANNAQSVIQVARTSVFSTAYPFVANGAGAIINVGQTSVSAVNVIATPNAGGAINSFGTNEFDNYNSIGAINPIPLH